MFKREKALTAKDLNVTWVDSPLRRDIILDRRRFFQKVKADAMKALVWAAQKRTKSGRVNAILDKVRLFGAVWGILQMVNRYPEPTRQNCYEPLTFCLFDFWDEFLKWENNPEHPEKERYPLFGREQLWKAVRKIELCQAEHDWYYRQRDHWRIMWFIKAYLEGKVPELLPTMPDRRICWDEPLPKERLLTWLEFQHYKEKAKAKLVEARDNDKERATSVS